MLSDKKDRKSLLYKKIDERNRQSSRISYRQYLNIDTAH